VEISSKKIEQLTPLQRSFLVIEQLQSKLDVLEKSKTESIAIVGMGCRFPGSVSNPQDLWNLLRQGRDAITEVPSNRWDIEDYYDPNPETPGKMSTRYGGFVDYLEEFDALFFGISAKEALFLDPQQRLLLEVVWESLENAAINPDGLAKTKTGVFIGIGGGDYGQLIVSDLQKINAYFGSGNAHCTAAGRLSYTLGLMGPNMAIDTACSSSLVSIHLACSSLLNKESDLALAGGVNLIISPLITINHSKANMLSSDGRCKTFDTLADGFVRSEGCGIVVLKRLSDAIADRDNILAVIRASAINQDGHTSGLTVPNGTSQETLIRQTLEKARVKPEKVSYVEAHGTGTSLGDPIEVGALGRVFGKTHSLSKPLMIGSIKTNIGHAEAAAGVAGLMKVVLQLKNQEIVPHLHFKQPNPYINWEELPIVIPTQLTPWHSGDESLIAGVSSFGFSGTNAHIVLEQAPIPVKGDRSLEFPFHILTLSAKTENALKDLVSSYQSYLENHQNLELGDICYTANTGRANFSYRLAVIASNQEELAQRLLRWQTNPEEALLFQGQLRKNNQSLPVAFLFTGQGSQYLNMGRSLYETHRVFRESLDECDRILSSVLDQPLLSVIYPSVTDEANSSILEQTVYTQPALFAIEYALAKLWESWGVKPDVVMGHSLGEYVAATVAGIFSLEDGLKLVAARARLMQNLPMGGEMVAVMASESKVRLLMESSGEKVAIAAINGPESVVISGESEAIQSLCAILESQEIQTKQLQVSHAFHSPLMEPMLAEFQAIAEQVNYHLPEIKLISNVTGLQADSSIVTAQYWVDHICKPVKFAASMKNLHSQGYEVFLEIGCKPILLGMGKQCLPEDFGVWLPSIRPIVDEWQQMLSSLGKLYVQGVSVDWSNFYEYYAFQKVILPNYPFQKQRYWIENTDNKKYIREVKNTGKASENTSVLMQLINQGDTNTLVKHLEKVYNFSPEELNLLPDILKIIVRENQKELAETKLKDWFYAVQWKEIKQIGQKSNDNQPSHWLIFADSTGVATAIANQLKNQGHECSLVYISDCYQKQKTGIFYLNPSQIEEFEQLYQEILKTSKYPLAQVIHLWSLNAPTTEDLTISSLKSSQLWGCGSVLHLLQAIVKNSFSSSPKLWLVTRGAQPVYSPTEKVTVAQAPLWGLGRVISLEHPQLWGGVVDLNPENLEDEEKMLLDIITNNNVAEDHLAIRGGKTYVARLVKQVTKEAREISLSSDATYLITGGLGALGLHTAQWMANKGAKNIVLMSRSKPSQEVQKRIEELEATGVSIVTWSGDISNEQNTIEIFRHIQTSLPPLKGVIHSAGTLSDSVLQQMSWEQFTQVMAPKLEGTWYLHKLTENLELDFFVCFSSIASLLGSPGQGNYAAANAFMDGLSHYRSSLKLPSLSINWGPWEQGGMVDSLANQHQSRIRRTGISSIDPADGVVALEQLLLKQSTTGQVGVLSAQWSVVSENFNFGQNFSLLWKLLENKESEQELEFQPQIDRTIMEKLEGALETERPEIFKTHLEAEVAKVMGLNSTKLPEPNLGFVEMGMDSLMAVELNNRLQSQLGISLPTTLAFEYPTIEKLSQYFCEEIMGWKSFEQNDSEITLNTDVNEKEIDLQGLSDEEAEAKLMNTLNSMGY